MPAPLKVTIWNEFRHERDDEAVRRIYPHGIHAALAASLKPLLPQAQLRTATLDEPDHGLTEELLASTSVLTWWAHRAHAEVRDDIVQRIHQRVLQGMGLLVLHSAHYSKPFIKLMGTGCGLSWRDSGELERLFVVNPAHPIADGIPPRFDIPQEEMYSEFFDIPTPDELVMLSWFAGGNVFRSLCTWTRGKGKIVYFRPGHETFPTYHQPEVLRIIANAIQWAAPASNQPYRPDSPHEPRSPLPT